MAFKGGEILYYYENRNGDSIIIGYDTDEYILKSIDGVDYLKNNITSVKGLYQDGSTITNTEVQERDITIVGLYKADDFSKENLLRVFNPKLSGILYYIKNGIKRKINCVVEASPVFKVGSFLHEFQVRLVAHDPYWKDDEDTEVIFASINPNFEFPKYFTDTFDLATIDNIKAKDVINDGDVAAPIYVEFIANGPVTNPYIKSASAEIRLTKINLVKGDRIIITTDRNNKKVTIYRVNGTIEKGFKYLHYMSTYIQLVPGITRFTFGAEANEENLGIIFKFTKRYVGVV